MCQVNADHLSKVQVGCLGAHFKGHRGASLHAQTKIACHNPSQGIVHLNNRKSYALLLARRHLDRRSVKQVRCMACICLKCFCLQAQESARHNLHVANCASGTAHHILHVQKIACHNSYAETRSEESNKKTWHPKLLASTPPTTGIDIDIQKGSKQNRATAGAKNMRMVCVPQNVGAKQHTACVAQLYVLVEVGRDR